MIFNSSLPQEATMPEVKMTEVSKVKKVNWLDQMFKSAYKDLLRMPLALLCMRIVDSGSNGLMQCEIADRMKISSSALSKMFNLKRIVHFEDVQAYCAAEQNKSTAQDFLDYATAACKNKKLVAAVKVFVKAKGRKERNKARSTLLDLLKPFALYGEKK